jgi:hypothetical protein
VLYGFRCWACLGPRSLLISVPCAQLVLGSFGLFWTVFDFRLQTSGSSIGSSSVVRWQIRASWVFSLRLVCLCLDSFFYRYPGCVFEFVSALKFLPPRIGAALSFLRGIFIQRCLVSDFLSSFCLPLCARPGRSTGPL